jgi:hypothetical protein
LTTQKAWYTYPRVDAIGTPDPYGGFPKPDTNIQLPDGYPVTSLFSGLVTGVDSTSGWACSVTIKLDKPINALATHTAYLHMGPIAVKMGARVKAGQYIGPNGGGGACGAQKVPLGFALYNGDNYGYGAAWALMTKANLLGPLNPVPVILAAIAGKLGDLGSILAEPLNILIEPAPDAAYTYLSKQGEPLTRTGTTARETLNNVPGFEGIVMALDQIEQFQPFELKDKSTGNDIGVIGNSLAKNVVDLPSESIQALITFTFANSTAFLVRGTICLIGIVMVVGVIGSQMAGETEGTVKKILGGL